MDTPNNSISQHLEGFLLSARKLEDALSEEKKRSQKIAQEYLATRTTLENAVRELQNRLGQRENKIQAISAAYQKLQASGDALRNELREISEREKKNVTELAQYKTAWNEVLARETQARDAILENEKSKTQINVLDARLQEAHANAAAHSRDAQASQRELQSALIRIQSTESKYMQIQKELSILTQSKRNIDEEITRIEARLNESAQRQVAAEKARLRTEIEKESGLEREKFREAARAQMRSEIERQVGIERQAREAAEARYAEVRSTIAETENRRNQDNERARSRVQVLAEETQTLKSENESLKRENAIHRMEANRAQITIETIRKDSSKAMLIERLRNDEEIRALRAKIDLLVETGVYAEKVETVAEGTKIYTATPVSGTQAAAEDDFANFAIRSTDSLSGMRTTGE